MVVALTGGVGGGKLVQGLSELLGDELHVVINTGDDIELYGLRISPDIDIITYTLGGIVDPAQGWGVRGDTFNLFKQIQNFGEPGWFKLGDRDLATHVFRTSQLRIGKSLSEITKSIAESMNIQAHLIPMSDEPVQTRILTNVGDLNFQEFLVARRAMDTIYKIYFRGIEFALPSKKFISSLDSAKAIIIGPSNPYVSIGPILGLPGIKEKISILPIPKVAVSPVVGGKVIKGPLGKMLTESGLEISSYSIAKLYQDIIDVLIIDQIDAGLKASIEGSYGIKVIIANTIMNDAASKRDLARTALQAVGVI